MSGAFGDLGTSLPLLVGIVLASGADPASTLILFGALQLLSALLYGLPMPVQPLKAVAALVMAQGIAAPIMYGAGLSVGVVMLVLTVTGLLTWLGKVIPKSVVRGIQFGLGLKLAALALGTYVAGEGVGGYVLAAVAFCCVLLLLGHGKLPPGLIVVLIGFAYSFVFKASPSDLSWRPAFELPNANLPTMAEITEGFLVLGLAQIPLSLGNSLLATRQVAQDLFPEKGVTIKKIGFTFSLMNLIAPFLSGIPVCHGSGGVVGMHFFGGRTGGCVALYGGLFLFLGLFFSENFSAVLHVFPMPVLGVLLLFEGLALIRLIGDQSGDKKDFALAVLVGVAAFSLPYGFLIGLLGGTALAYLAPLVNLHLESR